MKMKTHKKMRTVSKMKNKGRLLLSLISVLMVVILLAGCSSERTPYENNDSENYTVSVKFDANGGTFTTSSSVIIDSYNLEEVEKNSKGEAEIALLTPDNKSRGKNAFSASKAGYFFAGWYTERSEVAGSKDNYTYSGRWDFSKDLLTVDCNKQYSSAEPVLTLYAAWVPLFKIDFYSFDSEELLGSYSFDPNEVSEISVPKWDEETGMIDMFDFPQREGYTFTKAYFDEQGTKPVDTDSFKHIGTVDYETATPTDNVMKLYVEWREGEWYKIYNADQLADNADLDGNYEICADLDFKDSIWPTVFMYGNFGGVIKGNGHTLKNIDCVQTNNSKVNAGLFGYLTETASISDVTFENVNFTIKSGTRVAGTNYGLLAGTVSDAITLDKVKIFSSKLLIDSSCYFGVDDYSIGLVCGMGEASLEKAQIDCAATGDKPENLKITVNGNAVTVNVKDE